MVGRSDVGVHLSFGCLVLLIAAVVVYGVICLDLDFLEEVRDLLAHTVPTPSTVIWYVFLLRKLANPGLLLSVGKGKGSPFLGWYTTVNFLSSDTLTKEPSFWLKSVAIFAAEKGGMLKRSSINCLLRGLENLSPENAREYRCRSVAGLIPLSSKKVVHSPIGLPHVRSSCVS